MTRSFLMISPYYAPHRAVGAKRTLSFSRRLPALGYTPAVVALPPGDEADPRLEALIPEVPISYCLRGGPAAWGEDLAVRFARPPSGSAKRTLYASDTGERATASRKNPVARWGEALSVFDKVAPYLPWTLPRVVRFARAHRCALVYATSGPPSSLSLGRAVARICGLPLVLDLRDPWSIEPNYRARWSAEGRRLVDALEGGAFRAADRVVLNTRSARDAYRVRYPEIDPARFDVVRNFFDPDFFESPPGRPDPDGPFRIIYFGHLRPSKNALLFLEALATFIERAALPDGAIEVLTLGEMTAADQARIDALGLGGVVTRGGWLPLPRALELLGTADLLLDLMGPNHHLQISGKLFDYMAAGRPVLSITANPELADIYRETGQGQAVGHDKEAIIAALARAFERRRAGTTPPIDPDVLARYGAGPAAAHMARIFDDVCEVSR